MDRSPSRLQTVVACRHAREVDTRLDAPFARRRHLSSALPILRPVAVSLSKGPWNGRSGDFPSSEGNFPPSEKQELLGSSPPELLHSPCPSRASFCSLVAGSLSARGVRPEALVLDRDAFNLLLGPLKD